MLTGRKQRPSLSLSLSLWLSLSLSLFPRPTIPPPTLDAQWQAKQEAAALATRREKHIQRAQRSIQSSRQQQAREATVASVERAHQARGTGDFIAPGYMVLTRDPRGVI